jgi:hypothetical protein
MRIRARIPVIIAGTIISVVQTQGHAVARPGAAEFGSRIAALKSKTAALVASGRASLEALPPPQRLTAPPAVRRRVLGATRAERKQNFDHRYPLCRLAGPIDFVDRDTTSTSSLAILLSLR